MNDKISRYAAAFCAFCLLNAAYSAPLTAALASGLTMITALSTSSGGGEASSGGIVLSAAYIGGPTDSGATLTFGNSSMLTGGTPPLVTFDSSKSDLSAAHAYPVPFKPSAGHTAITFTALTGTAKIRIYTISGELVRTLDKSDTGEDLEWDVRNAKGSPVDSGVYLYLIEGAGMPKKGKLMIIR